MFLLTNLKQDQLLHILDMIKDSYHNYSINSKLMVDDIVVKGDHLVIPTKYFLKSELFDRPHKLEFKLYYDADMLLLKLVDTGVLYDALAYSNKEYAKLHEYINDVNSSIDLDHDNGYLYFCLPLSEFVELDKHYKRMMLDCFEYVASEINKDAKIVSM